MSFYFQQKTDQPSQNSHKSYSANQSPELLAHGSTDCICQISTDCNKILNTVHTCRHLNLSVLNPVHTSKSQLPKSLHSKTEKFTNLFLKQVIPSNHLLHSTNYKGKFQDLAQCKRGYVVK